MIHYSYMGDSTGEGVGVKLTSRRPVLDVPGAVDHRVVESITRWTQTVALLQPVQVSSGHVVCAEVPHSHAADEASP